MGVAKIRPDSRTPRRLPKVRITMNPSEIGTRHVWSPSKTEVSAAVPAATETETVRM